MILAAHVGVGIMGKEGSQAARSADYSFAEFQFLKTLLFVHGREDYRRNSFLVAYMFYKNVLYVITQYYFGFASGFSGQTLYDALIYQFYNITCTSLPICWYATFDFEYLRSAEQDKDHKQGDKKPKYFLQNPELYGYGLRSEGFSVQIFGAWLLYGIWHAAVVYATTMFVLSQAQAHQADGKDMGFWVSGMAVYGSCVFVANAVVATRMHEHNMFSNFFFLLMFLGYFVMYWMFSYQGYIYGIFSTQLGIALIWLCYMFAGLHVFATEMMYTANQQAIDNCFDRIKLCFGCLSKEQYEIKIDDRRKYYAQSPDEATE